MKVHHIGYAVADMDKAKEAFSALGYQDGNTVQDVPRNVCITFIQNGATSVELIAPLSTGSPVDSILEKNRTGTPYHICYEVDDLSSALKDLKAKGFVTLIKPMPAPAIGECNVAFMYHKAMGVMELVEIKNA